MKTIWLKPTVTVIELVPDKEMGNACFISSGNHSTPSNAACNSCGAPKCWSNGHTTYSGEVCPKFSTPD